MKEKRYLTWVQKTAYGSGDFGSNFMYAFVTSFALIFLTDTIGLNAGIVGTLMMLSKCFGGVMDILFGAVMDRTRGKMGKARPWMFWSTFPLAVCEILLFVIPSAGQNIQYAYFFIVYTFLSSVFYTANNISYTALSALITRNRDERVQVNAVRFIFAMAAGVIISSVTVGLVEALGGGTRGWRLTAIIYTCIMFLFNMVGVLAVKELPEEQAGEKGKKSFGRDLKILLHNRNYMLIVVYYIANFMLQSIASGMGIYYCTYLLSRPALLGVFSATTMVPVAVGMMGTPFLVSRFGIYKCNITGAVCGAVFAVLALICGYMGNTVFMLIFLFLRYLAGSPMTGTMNAVIADAAEQTYQKEGVHIDGMMYSGSSMGIKVGSGLGSAICGVLLSLSGYNGLLDVQPEAVLHIIRALYLGAPVLVSLIMIGVARGLRTHG